MNKLLCLFLLAFLNNAHALTWQVVGGNSGSQVNTGTLSISTTGASEAITSTYNPAVTSLVDGMELSFKAIYSNTTSNLTFTPNSGVVTAKPIVKGNNYGLDAGDIYAGKWSKLQYNATFGAWVLLNPQPVPPGVVIYAAGACPQGYFIANGAAVNRVTFGSLFVTTGTNYGAGDGSTTFNLPDLRGEFIRGADNGRGVDSGRTLGSWQGDAIRNIYGNLSLMDDQTWIGATGPFYVSSYPSNSNYDAQSTLSSGINSWLSTFDASRQVPTAAEDRPRNIALNPCIKW